MTPQVRVSRRWSIILRHAMIVDGQPLICVNHKIAYPGRSAAQLAAGEMTRLDPQRMHVYRCHLTPAIYHFHLATRSSGRPPPYPVRQVALAGVLLAAPEGRVTRGELRACAPPASRSRNGEIRRVLCRWENAGFTQRDGQAVVLVDRAGLLEWLDELLEPHLGEVL